MEEELIQKIIKLEPEKDYYVTILLTATIRDLGFFDSVVPDDVE
jgi:hypothetical protein